MITNAGGQETYKGTNKSRWPSSRTRPSTALSNLFPCGEYKVGKSTKLKKRHMQVGGINILPAVCDVEDCAEEGRILHALVASGEVDDLDD